MSPPPTVPAADNEPTGSPSASRASRPTSNDTDHEAQRSTQRPKNHVDPDRPPVPSRHLPPASAPLTFPVSATMPPQHTIRPADFLPLLHCPACSRPCLLNAPTTLHCGHSVCSEHVTLPGPSKFPVFPGPPVMPACPLPTCSAVSPSAAPPHPNIPSDSNVVYYPPSSLASPSFTNGPVSVPNRVHDARLDVTLCKVLSLVHRSTRAVDERDDHLILVPPNDDGNPNDEADPGTPESRPQHISRSDFNPRSSSTLADLHDSPPPTPQSRQSDRPYKRQRIAQPGGSEPFSSAPLSSPETKFAKELLAELSCEICFMLFYQPTTTPCQHTFCAKCLQRALDHSFQCPLCRTELPGYSYFQDHPSNKLILSIILKAFPDIYADRRTTIEAEERDSRLDTPIFVCQLSFPGTPTILHFFEPRYRLMLRRCLETPTPRFGMIMPPRTSGGGTDFGTLLEIRTVQMFPDGRSMVETWGVRRFRVLERGSLDGYMVGRVEMIDDFPLDVDDALHASTVANTGDVDVPRSLHREAPASNAELMAICRQFLDKLRNGTAPWVVQRLNHTYGPEPVDDPANFSFWMALVLPIDEHEKAKLLPIRSPRLRLRLVVHWIEQLNNNWWFSSGCVIS